MIGKKIYISGPMTGLPEYNYPAFFKAEGELLEHGLTPLNPARDAEIKPEKTYEEYLRDALKKLLLADSIYLLKGWEHSKGARIEFNLAIELKMPIYKEE